MKKMMKNRPSNQGAAANRRCAGQSDGSDNLSAIVAAEQRNSEIPGT